MDLKTYLFRCKKENIQTLFWLVLGSLCVTAHGLCNANAMTQLVAGNLILFAKWIIFMVATDLIWSLQLRNVAIYTERSMQVMEKISLKEWLTLVMTATTKKQTRHIVHG